MKILKSKQDGFGAVELILILVIVALLGVVGWFVYDRSQDKSTNSTAATSSGSPNTTKSQTTTPTASELSIKELGIKVTLSDEIKDLVYEVSTSDGNTYANFSSQALLKLDPGCTAKSGALGAFGKINGTYNKTTAPGKLVKQFPVFYIVHTPMMGCPNGFQDAVNKQFEIQSKALQLESTYSGVAQL